MLAVTTRLCAATQQIGGQTHSVTRRRMLALEIEVVFLVAPGVSLIVRRVIMRVWPPLARYLAPLPLLLVVALAACSSAAATSTGHSTATTGGGVGATATPTPPPCATRATAQGEAWDLGQQVAGTVNGGAVTTLSNFVYPLGIPDENAVGNTP